MSKGQLTVDKLIEILKRGFDGDEPVWYRVCDDPAQCYQELWEKDVEAGSSGVNSLFVILHQDMGNGDCHQAQIVQLSDLSYRNRSVGRFASHVNISR